MTILRWGLLSTARINRALIPPLQNSERNTVSAVASRDLAKAEMARDPKLRAFGKKTYDSLVKEYKQAATKALGHAEFLRIVREMG